jgi:hypothetical protein
VGSQASPVALTLAGNGYDEATGRLTLVNNSVALPATSNCHPPFGAALNQELHLPSAAGRNSVVMAARLKPLIVAERPPSISVLRLRPRSFRTGTTISYRLDKKATTRFRVERSLPGRKSGRRWVRVRGRFSRVAGPGAARFHFAGRVGSRTLRPGNYRLVAVPRDALGVAGAVKRAAFRVER